MAQLVLLVVAGITGLVGYSEAAKIEKRFRRGPLGVPAFAWGFVGLICAALVGQFLGAEVVVAALIGFVAYSESAKYEKQSGAVPWGIPPLAWGVGCASLGLIGALVESTFPVWLVFGFVGYREAAMYETQYGKPVLRVPALVWSVGCFFVGLVGGLVVSALAWSAACVIVAVLIAANVLLLAERNALLAEKNAAVVDKKTKPVPRGAPRPEPEAATPPPPRPRASRVATGGRAPGRRQRKRLPPEPTLIVISPSRPGATPGRSARSVRASAGTWSTWRTCSSVNVPP